MQRMLNALSHAICMQGRKLLQSSTCPTGKVFSVFVFFCTPFIPALMPSMSALQSQILQLSFFPSCT